MSNFLTQFGNFGGAIGNALGGIVSPTLNTALGGTTTNTNTTTESSAPSKSNTTVYIIVGVVLIVMIVGVAFMFKSKAGK